MYRFLLVAGVVLWAVLTLFLLEGVPAEVRPLVEIRFSDGLGLLWFISGTGLLALGGRALLGIRSAQEQQMSRFETLSTYLNEAAFICNSKGRVRWRNEAAADLLDGETLPENLRLLLKRAQTSRRVALQTIPLGEGMRFAVQALPLDRQHYALICRPLQSVSGPNSFYESFIRRIVHDMRNPLAAIIGHAANIRQSGSVEPEHWQKSAATIEDEAQRLARLVDSLLFDARLAYVPLQTQRIDLADVLEEALYAQDERAEQEGKTLAMEAPPGPMRMEGDRDLLVRAFENLIDNSLKYSGPQGKLSIRLQDQNGTFTIQFADNGEGIPPEYLPDKIFEPLVRAKPHGSGSGLGLSIVRKIIEMHGGTISAQSRLGAGTTMTVRLPKPLGEPR